jgi:L-asparagine transporter-like permease
VSSGGFALLFTYAAILATHIRFRKKNGCPPEGKCQMPGYPYASWIALISMIIIILSMPFISGQSSGLIAGLIMLVTYMLIYMVMKFISTSKKNNATKKRVNIKKYHARTLTEFSKELTKEVKIKEKNKTKGKKY